MGAPAPLAGALGVGVHRGHGGTEKVQRMEGCDVGEGRPHLLTIEGLGVWFGEWHEDRCPPHLASRQTLSTHHPHPPIILSHI